jgi:hypothetical protein
VLLACALVCGNRLWSPGNAGGVAVVGGSYSHCRRIGVGSAGCWKGWRRSAGPRWGMPTDRLRTYPSCCARCAPRPEGPRGRTARAVLHDRPPGHPVLATALGWSAACGAGSVCDGRLPVVGQRANSG